MAFTEEQEKAIKNCLPDFYEQLAQIHDTLKAQKAEIEDLSERLVSMESWKTALRLRIRQEKTSVL